MKLPVTGLYALACLAYRVILRDLVRNTIDDPNSEWDEAVIKMLDAMFNYSKSN